MNYGSFNIKELENKILSQEQISIFNQFLDSFQINNQIKNDIKYLINDYNNIIKSHLNLLQNTKNIYSNTPNSTIKNNFTPQNNITTYNNYNNYSSRNNIQNIINNKNFSNINPNNNHSNLNTYLNSNLNNKTNNNNNNYIPIYYDDPTFNEKSIYKTLKRNESFNKENYDTTPEIIKVKITNEILKTIKITLNNPKLFSLNYTEDNNYKTFIDNLLNYKYSLNTLNDIKNDIERVSRYTPKINNKKKIVKEESSFDFSKSLRQYPDQYDDLDLIYKKPFIRFTSNYGGYFDKDLNRISSPLKHKKELE